MIKFLLTIGFMVCFASCSRQHEEIFPISLQGRKTFELGELVLLLMPDAAQEMVGWEHRSNSDIQWITSGYTQREVANGETEYYRDGMARVNIKGKISTVLRERVAELGWLVSYRSASPPKFGVESIHLVPGTREESCFGTNYEGCWFESPVKSLSSASITPKLLCSVEKGSEGVKAYELQHYGKRSVVLYWHESGGSGGSSSWLVLNLRQAPSKDLCRVAERKYFPSNQSSGADPVSDNVKSSSDDLKAKELPTPQGRKLEYDVEYAKREAMFNQFMAEASHCMQSGAKVMLMQGARDREQILLFQTNVCGGPLIKFLISDGSLTTVQASAFVRALAEQILLSLPGVK